MFSVKDKYNLKYKCNIGAQMKDRETLYDGWITDFRKILFCIAVIGLGTLYNVREPSALAIAVVVQGASNVDSFWDFLSNKKIYTCLRVLSVIVILLSVIVAVFAIWSLGGEENFFDTANNQYAGIWVVLVIVGVAFVLFPLITDIVLNMKKEQMELERNVNTNKNQEEDDEI